MAVPAHRSAREDLAVLGGTAAALDRPLARLRDKEDLGELYLDLLEQTLTGAIWEDVGLIRGPDRVLAERYDEQARLVGNDWPVHAPTMIGLTRLRHLRQLVGQVLADGIPGDFIETGVWRGGACIYMRALLAVHGVKDRRIWVADSFEGLPAPDIEKFPADRLLPASFVGYLAVPLEEVKRNFAKYNMLDEQVVFLKGWFKDTLPQAPIERLAILRLDGDLYESTIEALSALYGKVSSGGFIVVDDWRFPPCRRAVREFRARNHIVDSIENIDGSAVFWRKSTPLATHKV